MNIHEQELFINRFLENTCNVIDEYFVDSLNEETEIIYLESIGKKVKDTVSGVWSSLKDGAKKRIEFEKALEEGRAACEAARKAQGEDKIKYVGRIKRVIGVIFNIEMTVSTVRSIPLALTQPLTFLIGSFITIVLIKHNRRVIGKATTSYMNTVTMNLKRLAEKSEGEAKENLLKCAERVEKACNNL